MDDSDSFVRQVHHSRQHCSADRGECLLEQLFRHKHARSRVRPNSWEWPPSHCVQDQLPAVHQTTATDSVNWPPDNTHQSSELATCRPL